jgi:hypothetical protein
MWLGIAASVCLLAQTQRGVLIQPNPAGAAGNGAYYALVIGINQYPRWPALRTAVNDAQSVDAVLRQRYGFQTTVLVDAAATRTNILKAFGDYRRRLHDNDNLLIYYAGHGARDGDKAYWLPVDSDPDSTANWIIADEVTKGMQVIPARHILVISDSCYSGGLSRAAAANTAPTDRTNYIQTMLASKSRVLISSGRDEPVADGGAGGHSVFANAILNGLRSAPEQAFTASNLFSRYVQETVVGGSKQVPLFQMIQDSGHEYGDFVFMAKSGAVSGGLPAPTPTVDRRSPPPAGGGVVPPHNSNTRLAGDGRSSKAGPLDASGAVPLTDYRVALLEFRDFPEAMSDARITDIAKYQVSGELSNWRGLDQSLAGSLPPGVVLNPQRSKFIFEWQKEIGANAGFAASALLPLFLRPDADWSFLKKEKGWDEQYDAYVYVFLFEREKIQGRQPEFVARELAPVVKKMLQMAVAKAPTKLYFDVPLKTSYDINQGAIRFLEANTNQPGDTTELLMPVQRVTFVEGQARNLPAPTDRDYHSILPSSARTTANYNRSFAMTDVPLARPGVIVYGADPQEVWRKSITGNTQDIGSVALGGFAFDRQLKLRAVPLDPKRAEPMVQALRNLHARVYFAAGKVDVFQVSYERQFKLPQALLFGHVERVDILGPKDEVIASVAGSALPAASEK